MNRPVIGITSHALHDPLARSAVGQQYIDAIASAGGVPFCIPIGLDIEARRTLYNMLDGLLLPGGDDLGPERYGHSRHPLLGLVDERRDELEISVAQWALADCVPILGICRGIQVLAVAAGGTLYQDVPSELRSAVLHDVREFGRDHLCHTITVHPGSRLHGALGSNTSHVNSFHHQAVRDVPNDFVVSAVSEDGIVEAIESSRHGFAVGVQCHPEGMWRTTAPEFEGLFRAFVDAARGYSMNAEDEPEQQAV